MNDQGSIYIGTEGVLYSPYIAAPILLPAEKFQDYKCRAAGGQSLPAVRRGVPRQRQDLDAVRLLRPADRVGAARLPGDALPQERPWSGTPAKLKITNEDRPTLVRRRYRKGWEVEGL